MIICCLSPSRLTAELLRLLCLDPQVKEQVKIYEGVPILLSLLHSDHLKLLWSVVWILVQICEDPDTSMEIRIWGGLKQLLHILQGYVSQVINYKTTDRHFFDFTKNELHNSTFVTAIFLKVAFILRASLFTQFYIKS